MANSRFPSHFFTTTLAVAAISWTIALATQAVVNKKLGNGPVGTLWFTFVLQMLLIGIISHGITSGTLPQYHALITASASIAIVLAIIGIDRNLYNPAIDAQ
ncbi:hypothetical protein H0H81_001716 [Sphagnurus paluster]|uniref:Uncharacterized protein n=1 Tax=Sphagnurus paluster TaxID=117069 RepID=A0A9P7FMC2_9AGAR|nr:hypothetical protein H0H81_001716 [Sphagnurus paluster]